MCNSESQTGCMFGIVKDQYPRTTDDNVMLKRIASSAKLESSAVSLEHTLPSNPAVSRSRFECPPTTSVAAVTAGHVPEKNYAELHLYFLKLVTPTSTSYAPLRSVALMPHESSARRSHHVAALLQKETPPTCIPRSAGRERKESIALHDSSRNNALVGYHVVAGDI